MNISGWDNLSVRPSTRNCICRTNVLAGNGLRRSNNQPVTPIKLNRVGSPNSVQCNKDFIRPTRGNSIRKLTKTWIQLNNKYRRKYIHTKPSGYKCTNGPHILAECSHSYDRQDSLFLLRWDPKRAYWKAELNTLRGEHVSWLSWPTDRWCD